MKRELKGKHIWLVGASTGIGRSLARELSLRGAELTLSARSLDKLESLAGELGKATKIIQLDVTDSAKVEKAAESFQQLDGVVFLAAAYNPQQGEELVDPELVDQIVSVNLTGAIHVSQAVRGKLVKQPDSFLVLYASIAGYRGLPNGQPYSATKAGLINYAESLRTELEGRIDVKVINSGFVDTRITRKNKFHMPMLMTTEEAAKRIVAGLERKGFEIYFPFRFALMAKLLRILPNFLFFTISRRFRQ